MAGSLSIDPFNCGYKPVLGDPGSDDSTPATWPASTSTLICGDAVLADAQLTTSEGERLPAWVRKRLLTAAVLTVAAVQGGEADG